MGPDPRLGLGISQEKQTDYRVAYDEFAEEAQELEEKFGPDWKNEYECRVYDPPKHNDEDYQKWIHRCEIEEDKTPRRVPVDEYFGEEFGLSGMFDPLTSTTKEVRFKPPNPYPLLVEKPEDLDGFLEEVETYDFETGEENGGSVTILDRELAVLVFDLKLSAEAQTKSLNSLLAGFRESRGLKNPHLPSERKEWKKYLRVLDANLAECSEEDIAKELWPKLGEDDDPVEKAKSALKNARRWTKRYHYNRLLIRHLNERHQPVTSSPLPIPSTD